MLRTSLGEKVCFSASALLKSALVLTVSSMTSAYALPITVNVTIPRVRLIVGTDPTGPDELYSQVNINNSGFQQSGIVGGVNDGNTINPNWSFNSTIDPRGRTNYNIPIALQLWDDDAPQSDEQIDINPNPGRTLNLTYDLQRRVSSLSSPQTGNPPGDRATLHFNITSNAFQYLVGFSQLVTLLGPGLWQYEYTLTNLTNSTFDIDAWRIPFIGNFDLALQPGESFGTGPFRSTSPPGFFNSAIVYDDLNRTTRISQILAPVPTQIPEPASLALFSIGLASFGLIRLLRKQAID